jgi:hypothetical protein
MGPKLNHLLNPEITTKLFFSLSPSIILTKRYHIANESTMLKHSPRHSGKTLGSGHNFLLTGIIHIIDILSIPS